MAAKYIHTVGKRKTSIARVWMKPGKGDITINRRTLEDYLIRDTSRMVVMQPLEITNSVGKYDIRINVMGGGLQGQAGAIRHAISRALANQDVELRVALKREGLLTRDSRKKERKLPGRPAARKRFQYSKR